MATLKETVVVLDPSGSPAVLRPGDEAPEWFEPGNPEVLEPEKKPARTRAKKAED